MTRAGKSISQREPEKERESEKAPKLKVGGQRAPRILVYSSGIASSITSAKRKLEYSCDRLEYSAHDKRIQYYQHSVLQKSSFAKLSTREVIRGPGS